jgi:hypothetical protein
VQLYKFELAFACSGECNNNKTGVDAKDKPREIAGRRFSHRPFPSSPRRTSSRDSIAQVKPDAVTLFLTWMKEWLVVLARVGKQIPSLISRH